jgi:hypothetical protein
MLSTITNKMNDKMEVTTNALDKRTAKKSEPLGPTIRFDLKLEKPSSDKFSKFNYNALVLKTLVSKFH